MHWALSGRYSWNRNDIHATTRKVLFVGIIGVCAAITGLFLWLEAEMLSRSGPQPSGHADYDVVNFIGLFVFVVFFVPGVSLVYVGVSTLAYAGGGPFGLISVSLLGLMFIVVGCLGGVWGRETMRCLGIFCIGNVVLSEHKGIPEAGVAFRSGLGLAIFSSFVPVGIVLLLQVMRRAVVGGHRWDDTHTLQGTTRRLVHVLIFICASLFVLFWVTISLYMPNSLESFLPMRIAKNAKLLSSQNHTLCRTEPHTYTCPDLPWSWIHTRNVIITESVVLKIYPSNLFFYGYVFVVLFTVPTVRSFRYGRKLLKRRCPVLHDCTYGEVSFVLLTCCMIVLSFSYWIQGHNFKQHYTDLSNKIVSSERWYRSMGQLTVTFLSLCIFPVSRYSVLHWLLGSSWESSIWVHKLLGYGVLFGTVGHVVGWCVRCYEVGVFPRGVLSIPATDPPAYRDDYTVPLATWTTLPFLTATFVFTLEPVRRRFYEIFYCAHVSGFCILAPTVLWHAASAWEYFLPGLTIWFVDWLLRIYRRGLTADLVSATVSGPFVELCFRHSSLNALPGQYVFINVPDISLLQWHPFSARCEHSGCYALCIKSVGENTWTGKLVKLVCESGLKFTLNIEGPCGRALNTSDHETIVLIAGGIGITPCVSIYSHLQDRMAAGLRTPASMLLWTLRDSELLCMVSDMCHSSDSLNAFAAFGVEGTPRDPVRIFFTGDSIAKRWGGSAFVKSGRMDVCVEIPQLIRGMDPGGVLLFVCGPPSLVESVRSVAHSLGVSLHQETFLL